MNKKSIKNEMEAYEHIAAYLRESGKTSEFISAEPVVLQIRVKGDKFEHSITPATMKFMVEMQNEINRYHAWLKCGKPDARYLSKEEAKDLDITVEVQGGSSSYFIHLFLIKNLEVLSSVPPFIVGALCTCLLGSKAISSFFDFLKFRERERNETKRQRDRLEYDNALFQDYLGFIESRGNKGNGDESQDLKLLVVLAKKHPELKNEISQLAMVILNKSMGIVAQGSDGEIQGNALKSDDAKRLADILPSKIILPPTPASEDDPFAGNAFRVLKMSRTRNAVWLNLKNTQNKSSLKIALSTDSLKEKHEEALTEAFWEKIPVKIEFKAHLGKYTIVNCKILSISLPSEKPH
jgi:hypothetical protein